MDDLFKLAASSAGFAGLICIYLLVWGARTMEKLRETNEEGFRQLRETVARNQEIELLRIIRDLSFAPDLRERANNILQDVKSELKNK